MNIFPRELPSLGVITECIIEGYW